MYTTLDKDTLYRAMLTRDRRYDGRFYVGVHTTGIYCRPVCPARPRIENVGFYRSQAEAEAAGFRACLRCRPDLSPTSRIWQGTAAVVGRALALIAAGALDEGGVEALALRLGLTDRHLRRLFEQHLGASPVQVAASRRLHLAKQLLLQTPLPVSEVALAAGFQSLRRFNQSFKERFKVSPTEVRRGAESAAGSPDVVRLELPYLPPYDWAGQLAYVRRHTLRGIEVVEGEVYRRAFVWEGQPGWVGVAHDGAHHRLLLEVHTPDVRALKGVVERVREKFDLGVNPWQVAEGGSGELGKILAACVGVRIPGAWDPFETAVCVILGQLVSTEAAQNTCARLVEHLGHPLDAPLAPGLTHHFPSPEVLAAADLGVLRVPRVKAGAISALARAVAEGDLDLSPAGDLAETRAKLLAIRGIGPWTVEMIALCCLRDTNAFPGGDLILRRALELHGEDGAACAPWRAYLAIALWKTYAATLTAKRPRGAGGDPGAAPPAAPEGATT